MLCTPQVRTPTQEVRADAAVNSGNTLAAWAELMPAAEAIQMLDSAQQAYQAALAQEQDAAVSHLLYPAALNPLGVTVLLQVTSQRIHIPCLKPYMHTK